MNKPINRLIISSTSAVTNLEAACPITNAIAKPIIPNVKEVKELYDKGSGRHWFF